MFTHHAYFISFRQIAFKWNIRSRKGTLLGTEQYNSSVQKYSLTHPNSFMPLKSGDFLMTKGFSNSYSYYNPLQLCCAYTDLVYPPCTWTILCCPHVPMQSIKVKDKEPIAMGTKGPAKEKERTFSASHTVIQRLLQIQVWWVCFSPADGVWGGGAQKLCHGVAQGLGRTRTALKGWAWNTLCFSNHCKCLPPMRTQCHQA